MKKIIRITGHLLFGTMLFLSPFLVLTDIVALNKYILEKPKGMESDFGRAIFFVEQYKDRNGKLPTSEEFQTYFNKSDDKVTYISNIEEIKNKYAHQSINDYVIIYESRGAEQIYLSWEKPTAKNNQQIWYPKIQIAGLILLVNAMWIVILITLGNLLKKESNEESMV